MIAAMNNINSRQKIGKKFMPCLTDTQYALEALEEYNKKIG